MKTKREAPAEQREHGGPRNKPRNKKKAHSAEVVAETVPKGGEGNGKQETGFGFGLTEGRHGGLFLSLSLTDTRQSSRQSSGRHPEPEPEPESGGPLFPALVR